MTTPSPLAELLVHLQTLRDDPNNTLDTILVEQSRFTLHSPQTQPSQILELAHLTLILLRTSTNDIEPLVRLLSESIELVTFDVLQKSIPIEVVTEGLSSPALPVQNLALSYLKKAAESPSGAAFVANDDALVKALLTVFLTSKSAEIGGIKALKVVLSLLSVDNPATVTTISDGVTTGQTQGQGLLWRRIFSNEEIHALFFHFTSDRDASHGLSRSEITTAQARLLDFVSEVAKLRWDAIYESTKSDLSASSKPQSPSDAQVKSLLPYAALVMVDRTDPLMTNILVDFLVKLLQVKAPAGCSGISSIPAISSPSLEFLTASGLHQRAIDYYLRSEDFDAFEIQFLGGAQIRYLCTYADLYPEHFLQSAGLTDRIITHLNNKLQISRARWAHGSSPVQDLNVLAHLPAIALIEASKSNRNPLLALPTNPANADAFVTMGKIFHGPNMNEPRVDEGLVVETNSSREDSRAAIARALFYTYHNEHPEFWSNVGAATNVLAMPQAASAAISLARSIVTACWAPLPEGPSESPERLPLPNEQSLRVLCGGNVSRTGLAEVLNAGESAVQSLLIPLKTMGGDAEAARLAWRLGREKFDLLVLVSDLMRKGIGRDEVPSQVWRRIGERIQERIRLDAAGGVTTQTNLVGTMGS